MRLRLVEIDETEYLGDKCRDQVGRLFTIYLYDADERTHCCELTPSHWLEAVFFETTGQIDDDLADDLNQGLYYSSHYRHCRDVEKLPTMTVTYDFEDFEEAREYFQCNCSFTADEEVTA